MTYCVGLLLKDGLVMLADTRTNAGVDNVSTYSKTFVWEEPGERTIVLMTAGNLAITQSVVNLVSEGIPDPEDPHGPRATLSNVPSLFEAARLVGRAIRQVHDYDAEAMRAQDTPFAASFLLGGQLKGRTMRLFQIYAAGNFINAAPDTPFLQIGEHKYGKPILDRALDYGETTLEDGVKLALLSMDSTVRSNLSVGFPLDLVLYRKDGLKIFRQVRIEDDNAYFQKISRQWSEALRDAYHVLPPPEWS
ncbi:proteasome-type protease [Rhodobium gokarnense]|uniref:Proteasome-type protease n=1 Tax=Rhodobium gokarnense TaxID=364296 RepID=A0ABT3HE31_9HYPH|nr:proteasome-type protease [Rhodobium gokarnense]MCW2308584.1 putative proteasome-type protease [Rhodobium gokarnense]